MNEQAMCVLSILDGEKTHTLEVPVGSNLRRVLLDAKLSPYASVTRRLNCGGRGLCATCGVWIESGEPEPNHWHDRIGAAFGYPRLSCQVMITDDMTVRLLSEKRIWGRPDSSRRWQGRK